VSKAGQLKAVVTLRVEGCKNALTPPTDLKIQIGSVPWALVRTNKTRWGFMRAD